MVVIGVFRRISVATDRGIHGKNALARQEIAIYKMERNSYI